MRTNCSHSTSNLAHMAQTMFSVLHGSSYGRPENLPAVLPSVMYPSHTRDPLESRVLQLKFFSKLDYIDGAPIASIDEEYERHAMYIVRMVVDIPTGDTSTTDVLAKFTAKYNDTAHRLLARQNPPFTPALHLCAPGIAICRWSLYNICRTPNLSAACLGNPAPNVEAIRHDLTKASTCFTRTTSRSATFGSRIYFIRQRAMVVLSLSILTVSTITEKAGTPLSRHQAESWSGYVTDHGEGARPCEPGTARGSGIRGDSSRLPRG